MILSLLAISEGDDVSYYDDYKIAPQKDYKKGMM